MNRVLWWLARAVARILEPDERDALIGDLTEARAAGHAALIDTLNLALRRQLVVWTRQWQPWAALVTVVLPVGALLSLAAGYLADSSAIYLFLYGNNWTFSYLRSRGARAELLNQSVHTLLNYATLASWAIAAGVALRSMAGRAIPSLAVLFGLMLMLFERLPDGRRVAHSPGNAAVFDVPYYAVVHPVTVQLCAVLVPFAIALFLIPRRWTTSVLPTLALTCIVVFLTIRAAEAMFFWTLWATPLWAHLVFPKSVFTIGPALMIAWPAAFVTAYAAARQWSRRVRPL